RSTAGTHYDAIGTPFAKAPDVAVVGKRCNRLPQLSFAFLKLSRYDEAARHDAEHHDTQRAEHAVKPDARHFVQPKQAAYNESDHHDRYESPDHRTLTSRDAPPIPRALARFSSPRCPITSPAIRSPEPRKPSKYSTKISLSSSGMAS